jgi:hypothetical protein
VEKRKGNKKSNRKGEKAIKTKTQKSGKGWIARKKTNKKDNKRGEPKIKVLTHKLLVSTLSYLILTPWWYFNLSNISSQTPPMSSLVFFYISSHYRSDLLPCYEPVSPGVSIGYVQIISNYVAQASPQLVPPLITRICHRFRHDLFLCSHKSIVACASQVRLVVGHVPGCH